MPIAIHRSLLTATVCALIFTSGCASPEKHAEAASALKPSKERRPAPDFSLKDTDGRTVRLSDYKGKVVLLNFWATWCSPCRAEIPWFIDFEQQHKNRGFAVLGVAMDDGGWQVVKPFIAELKMNYRTLMGDDSVAQLYGGVENLPTSFMIDRDGKIAAVHVGLVNKSDYENDIQQLLAASSGSARRGSRLGIPAVVVGAR